jgi:hypothetical protein
MDTFRTSLLIIFIAIMNVGGCVGGDEEGCSMSCRAPAAFGCPPSKDGCRCAYNRYACSSFSFNEEKRRCTISGCADCSIFGIGGCAQSGRSQQDTTLSESEFVTVFPLGEACDVIASADTENDCENLTIDRGCENSEFIPSEDDSFPNECGLYDCQQCLLESLSIDDEGVK